MSYTEVAQYFLDIFPTLSMTIDEVMDEWTQMAHERYVTQVGLKKGALEFLDILKKAGIKTGIATSNGRTLVDDTLEALKIRSLFDSVKCACEAAPENLHRTFTFWWQKRWAYSLSVVLYLKMYQWESWQEKMQE